MSWHKKDWLLAALGLGGVAAIPGVLPAISGAVGGLLGGAAPLATTAIPEGAELGLLGKLATPMTEASLLAPPQIPVEPGMLDKFGGLLGNKDFGRALSLANMAQGQQQPPPQTAPMQRPQPTPPQHAQADPRQAQIDEMRRRRAFGSFFDGIG